MITKKEVADAINDLKCNKASGVDNVSTEILKCPDLLALAWKFLSYLYKSKTVPEEWSLSPSSRRVIRIAAITTVVLHLCQYMLNCIIVSYSSASTTPSKSTSGPTKTGSVHPTPPLNKS